MKKVIFIGVNECNRNLLLCAAKTLPKGNYLTRLLKMNLLELTTEDTLDSELLEPWVQWVSIQTSTPSSQHGVKYLGDIKKLSKLQIWERLSMVGQSSIVWGAMNARRGVGDGCKVFLPDPWVFDEQPYPDEIKSISDFPRYLAKNYTAFSKFKLFRLSILFFKNYLNVIGIKYFIRFIKILFNGLKKFKLKKFVFICIFDYLSVAAFAKVSRHHNVDFSYLFLNSIAHVQHHHWNSDHVTELDEILFAFDILEECLALLDTELDLFSKEISLILCSGLGQINTNSEEPWILYRIKDMRKFLNKLSIQFSEVETLMSYDGHIFFNNGPELQYALDYLNKIVVDKHKLFFLMPDHDNNKLFFRVDISREINSGMQINAVDNILSFEHEVERIVTRTGKHHASSFVYHNINNLKGISEKPIQNHQIFEKIFPEVFERHS